MYSCTLKQLVCNKINITLTNFLSPKIVQQQLQCNITHWTIRSDENPFDQGPHMISMNSPSLFSEILRGTAALYEFPTMQYPMNLIPSLVIFTRNAHNHMKSLTDHYVYQILSAGLTPHTHIYIYIEREREIHTFNIWSCAILPRNFLSYEKATIPSKITG